MTGLRLCRAHMSKTFLLQPYALSSQVPSFAWAAEVTSQFGLTSTHLNFQSKTHCWQVLLQLF